MSSLNIRKDSCELDFLALGALVHRLDPGVIPFRKARSVDIHVSGGEYNVAAKLSDCFGLRTGIATAMVKYPIGELVQARVRETGVTPFYKWFEHDGVRGPNIATVYSDRGYGVRAAGGLLQPRQRGRRPAQAGRLRLGQDLRPRRALVPLRGHLRRALRDDRAADHRGDAGRQGRRGHHVVRPELPGQALGVRRRRGAGPAGHQEDRRPPRRAVRQRRRPADGPGHRRPRRDLQVEARPRHVLHADRPGRRAASQHQAGGDDLARGAFDQPARLGGRAVARRPAVREPDAASSTSSTASAAATASPPA